MNGREELLHAIKRKLPSDHLVTSARRWLEIGEVMSRRVVTIALPCSVYEAVRRMAEHRVSCIVVTQGDAIAGIVTETDLVRRLSDHTDLQRLPVEHIMTRPVITVETDLSILDACALLETHGIRRLVVQRDGRPVGIVTQTDVTQGLTSHGLGEDVGEVMTREVTTVSPTATVAEAVRCMAERRISCVVVMEGERIVGMFTERDLLTRVIAEQKDPKRTLIGEVMTGSVKTIPLSQSVFSAGKTMAMAGVRRLAVTDEGRLAGIITQTDLLDAMRRQLEDEERARRQALETSESSVFTLDSHARITYANPATARLLGVVERDTLIGARFLEERFWPDPSQRSLLEESLKQKAPDPRELHLQTVGGQPLFVVLFLVPVRSADGRIKGYHGTLRDVTREKMSERELERNYAAQRAFSELLTKSLEDLPLDTILQFFLERLVAVPWLMLQDRGLIALTDEATGELVVRAHHNLDPAVQSRCARITPGCCLCGRAAAMGEMVFSDRLDEQHEIRCASMEDHGHYCLPILSPSRGVLGVMTLYTRCGHDREPAEETFLLSVCGLLAGVLERYETQKQIQSLARFPGEDPAPVLRVAADGTILYANAAAEPVLALWGRHLDERCPEDTARIVGEVLQSGQTRKIDVVVANRVFSLFCAPLTEEKYVNLYGREVTAERRAQRELRELNRALAETVEELEVANLELRDFAKVIAHDLKAPVRAIGTLTQWIAADCMDRLDDRGREQMHLLIGRTQRLNHLLESVLQYSVVGRVESAKEHVDLNAVVAAVCAALQIPPHITVEVDGDMGLMRCHKMRLMQVFQNLLSNAVKYMDKPQGRIRVSRRDEGEVYRFEVTDNGPGIEQKHQQKVFQVLQTLDPRDDVESAGVGLALVKKIIEDMYDGQVGVESTPGVGSTFFFTLPKYHFPSVACPATLEVEARP
ncbi:MAG TPA: CBS domain-containing protein [Phycisphaerales bacterium]|nr:CBS domain-containing protein [Phycisphaerales bacterium]